MSAPEVGASPVENRRSIRGNAFGVGASVERTVRPYVLGILGIAALLAAWETVVSFGKVPLYVLPAPSVIGQQIVRDWPLLWRHARPTIVESLGGFALGNTVAILLAAAFVHSTPLNRALFPVAIGLRTVPLVAITPLLIVWLGNGYAPKVVIAALISFFPTLVNATRGFAALDQQALDLLHTMSASRWQVFAKVRWPSSLPYIFSALKIASTSAVLGAVVAEWIGSDRGLGYLVVMSTYEFRIPLLWAVIAVTSALALTLFGLVIAAEHFLSYRGTTDDGG